MGSASIWLEIGNDSLKMAVYSGGRTVKTVYERLPQNMMNEGKASVPDALSDFLAQIRRKYHIGRLPATLILPSEVVMTRKITMPGLTESEIRFNLPYELRDYLGNERKEDFVYGYSLVRTLPDGEKELTATVVRREVIESYDGILKKSGFRLKHAIPKEIAWQELFSGKEGVPADFAAVDTGHTHTEIRFFRDGRYEMGKTAEIGGREIDRVIAETTGNDIHQARTLKENDADGCTENERCRELYHDLSVELLKAIRFSRSQGANPEIICLSGGMAELDSLKKEISSVTGEKVCRVSELLPCTDRTAICEGAPLSENTADLVPHERRRSYLRVTVTAAVLALLLCLFVKFGIVDPMTGRARKTAVLSEKIGRLAELTDSLKDYDRILSEYKGYGLGEASGADSDMVPKSTVLSVITANIPKHCSVVSIGVSGNTAAVELGNLTLGEAGALVSSLRENENVRSADMDSALTENGGESVLVRITVIFGADGKEE